MHSNVAKLRTRVAEDSCGLQRSIQLMLCIPSGNCAKTKIG